MDGVLVHKGDVPRHSPTHIPRRNIATAFLGIDGRSPCPQEGCTRTFADPQGAKKHYHKVHLGIRYPCSSDDCQKTFSEPHTAKQHYRRVHLGIHERSPCPQEGCAKTFCSPNGAHKHYETQHNGRRLPCPVAETTGCESTFSTKRSAQDHYANVHLKERIPCPFRDTTGCTATFSQTPAVKNHVKRLHTQRWMCPVPTCRNTVSKQGISNGQIAQHMAKHDELGHLVGLDNPSPVQQSSLPTDITDCREKLKQLLSAPNIEGDQAEGEDQDIFNEDTEEESEEPDEYEAESDDLISLGLTVEGRMVMQVSKSNHLRNHCSI
jgi:hypothetical protein